jgi:hypothetical protein
MGARATLERLLARAERWNDLAEHLQWEAQEAPNVDERGNVLARLIYVDLERLRDYGGAIGALLSLAQTNPQAEAVTGARHARHYAPRRRSARRSAAVARRARDVVGAAPRGRGGSGRARARLAHGASTSSRTRSSASGCGRRSSTSTSACSIAPSRRWSQLARARSVKDRATWRCANAPSASR